MASAHNLNPMLHHAQLSREATELVGRECVVCFTRAQRRAADHMALILVDNGETFNAVIQDGPDRDDVQEVEFGSLLLRALGGD